MIELTIEDGGKISVKVDAIISVHPNARGNKDGTIIKIVGNYEYWIEESYEEVMQKIKIATLWRPGNALETK